MNSIIENQIEHPAANPVVAFKYGLIPPITDPLGKYWEQPDMSTVLINDKYAVMTERQFNKLADYTCSQPSGCYVGKCWKAFYSHGGWTLCWFGFSKKGDKYCSNNYRQILISNR